MTHVSNMFENHACFCSYDLNINSCFPDFLFLNQLWKNLCPCKMPSSYIKKFKDSEKNWKCSFCEKLYMEPKCVNLHIKSSQKDTDALPVRKPSYNSQISFEDISCAVNYHMNQYKIGMLFIIRQFLTKNIIVQCLTYF